MIASGNDEVIAMLQQQQAVLQEVLKDQEALKLRQVEMGFHACEQKLIGHLLLFVCPLVPAVMGRGK